MNTGRYPFKNRRKETLLQEQARTSNHFIRVPAYQIMSGYVSAILQDFSVKVAQHVVNAEWWISRSMAMEVNMRQQLVVKNKFIYWTKIQNRTIYLFYWIFSKTQTNSNESNSYQDVELRHHRSEIRKIYHKEFVKLYINAYSYCCVNVHHAEYDIYINYATGNTYVIQIK